MDNPPALRSAVPTFTPVPIKTRAGWTAAKQGLFIEALTDTGSVRMSTEAVGMAHTGVYRLRHMPGGESFARAWDEAVATAARRVRDVLIDHAIHGVPERVLIGRDTVVERRRFNHRTMIWVLQHHMPDAYPGGSTTHRRGWDGRGSERESARLADKVQASEDEVQASIERKLDAIQRPRMRAVAADPAKRAAYELLNGAQDWAAWTGEGSGNGAATSRPAARESGG